MIYPIWRTAILPIYRMWLRGVEGLNNLIVGKPFIIAANHASYYDSLLIPSIVIPKLNKKIHALVNSSYWKHPITRFILNQGESIPLFVRKEKYFKQKNKLAFGRALEYLKNGEIIMIFPEGTRSPDGKLKKGHTGVAGLALKAKVPVLPIGIIDAYKVLPRGKIFPRFKRCEVKIGKLINFDEYSNKSINKRLLENITRKIMKEIGRLSNQEYSY